MKKLITVLFLGIFCANCNSQQEILSVTTQELKILLSKDTIQLLDVRTPKEVKEGFIKTALFANYFDEDFVTKAIIQLDKSKPVFLYCRSGNRSSKASKILQEKGYNVYNVIGGYTKWKEEN